ncbi:MAG: lipopolysaccharide biosynthesis protein [Gammaproteobacteria bacterium]|nr:lipopolysaccharide biosynthesis protein [Gammaproteobacteria bacterium]
MIVPLRYKAFASYFSFSIATSALGFVASLLLMRFIPPEEFGRIALFMSIQFFVAPVISFAADNLIAINKSKLGVLEYEHFRRSYVTLAYIIFSAVQIIFALIFLSGIQHELLFLLVPFSALAKYLIGLASIEYVMEEKSVRYGLVAFLTTLFSLLLTVLFLTIFTAKADWRIAALLLADIVFLFVRYHGRMKLLFTVVSDKQEFKDITRFGLPLLLAVAPAWALNESDKIIVAHYVDIASVGLYAAACAIGAFMITFNTALVNAMIPMLYQALGEKSEDMLLITKRYLIKFMKASIIFAGGFALFYGLFADLILPEKYYAARDIVYSVVFFSLARSLYAVLGAVTDYFGMTMQKLKGIVFAGVTAVISIMLGVTQFGIAGAAVGVGIGYTMLSLVLWFELEHKSRSLAKITRNMA